MRTLLVALGLVTLVAAHLQAQAVSTQDSSLRRLQRTYVRFEANSEALTPRVRDQLGEYLTLELRKAGFTIAEHPEDLKEDEGLLEVSLAGEGDPRRAEFSLRIALQQRASLKRTGQALWMVTWYDESHQLPAPPDSAARALLASGLNRFLNRWLTANGR